MQIICDAFYSCGYAAMLLRTVVSDSLFSREGMLRDAAAVSPGWQQEGAAGGGGGDDGSGEGGGGGGGGGGGSGAAGSSVLKSPGRSSAPDALFDVLSIPQFQVSLLFSSTIVNIYYQYFQSPSSR